MGSGIFFISLLLSAALLSPDARLLRAYATGLAEFNPRPAEGGLEMSRVTWELVFALTASLDSDCHLRGRKAPSDARNLMEAARRAECCPN